jgi:hypothetical protein
MIQFQSKAAHTGVWRLNATIPLIASVLSPKWANNSSTEMPVLQCGRQVVAFLPQVFGKGEFWGYFSVFFAEFVSSSSCPDAKNMLSGGRELS